MLQKAIIVPTQASSIFFFFYFGRGKVVVVP